MLVENLPLLSQNAQPDLFIGAVRIKTGGRYPDRKYPEIAQGGRVDQKRLWKKSALTLPDFIMLAEIIKLVKMRMTHPSLSYIVH